MIFHSSKKTDMSSRIDYSENEVHSFLKPLGFRKHGRTLHRFVSGDISQVISFQCGQAYRGETHLMWVNTGIRVPECFERSFDFLITKKYYHEYDCNIRSRLGAIRNRNSQKVKTFDLRKDIEKTSSSICDEIKNDVLPVFDILSSCEAILMHRREYPWFDYLNHHLILLEEAMIYGHLGQKEKAKELFDQYYAQAIVECKNPGHVKYLDELRVKLELE